MLWLSCVLFSCRETYLRQIINLRDIDLFGIITFPRFSPTCDLSNEVMASVA